MREFDKPSKSVYCFDPYCKLRYNQQWNRKYCPNCGGILFSDKTIVVPTIKKIQIINFLNKISYEKNLVFENFNKTILRKKNNFSQIIINGISLTVLPITKILNNNELEILSFRFPNLFLIETMEQSYRITKDYKIISKSLFEFFYNIIYSKPSSAIIDIAKEVKANIMNRVRELAIKSSKRLNDPSFYIDKNSVYKNFGAELFEADCSVIFNYIFSNSIWLGASKRGKQVPDGISAFPISLKKRGGCFIWDAKFPM